MKFLADMGVSMTTVRALREVGHDAKHLREGGLMRMADPDIVAKARTEGRVVLTFDLDFGEIMPASGNEHPSVILFRLEPNAPRRDATAVPSDS
jgi:predicted nuclease of predicted toxin-antitoxin system